MIFITQDYKIVEKKETQKLINTFKEYNALRTAYDLLLDEEQENTKDTFNQAVTRILNNCYRYYNRKYDVKIDSIEGWAVSIEKYHEIQLGNICNTIRSWEN